MKYGVGSIVRARDRDWVVLPESTDELLRVQPLGGAAAEATAILTAIEEVNPSSFGRPELRHLGDHKSASILRDAARLQNRNTTGPFRSFGRVAIDLRPYQLVPLLLALRRETVRILIADDVGIGKTVEALMIARELLDRGEIQKFCVLCPRHLAEQWQREIQNKFHLDAQLYLAETADKVHAQVAAGENIFDRFPVIVASIDFIKMQSRRDLFLRHAPELVIVDEAHTCTHDTDGTHLRREVVQKLSQKQDRHLILVTATPHTGSEESFRNLISMLDPELARLPENLQGDHNRRWREMLAQYMVQRRRENLKDYLEKTPFPERFDRESPYTLQPDYKALLGEVIEASRKRYAESKDERDRRLTWWSLLSILRAFASSPAAAAATLRARSGLFDAPDVDAAGRQEILDNPDEPRTKDVIVGANLEDERFVKWADRAEALAPKDKKLENLTKELRELVKEGRNVIVFCQYIPTAKYVAEGLAKPFAQLGVQYVTGEFTSQDREARIRELAEKGQRILVATDCLSEGVNLQDNFDTVIHYDLAWTPTRHEQREGRVDRYGQPKPTVKTLTIYGRDNWIDGIVLEVLHRKHAKITGSTGVEVAVPPKAGAVLEAIAEGLLLRGKNNTGQMTLADFDLDIARDVKKFHEEWEAHGERAKANRTLFAQRTIRDEEVLEEIQASRQALGDALTVRRFVIATLRAIRAAVTEHPDYLDVDASMVDPEVRVTLGLDRSFKASFDKTVEGAVQLHRTHPIVEALSDFAIETAIDDLEPGPAARCAVIRASVPERHDVFLLRYRFQMKLKGDAKLVEEIRLVGLRDGKMVDEPQLLALLEATPKSNVPHALQEEIASQALESYVTIKPELDRLARQRCQEILGTHRRVRDAARLRLGQVTIEPEGEPDLIGVYTYLPEVRL